MRCLLMESYGRKIDAAALWLKDKTDIRPEIGLVLGSGLGAVAEKIRDAVVIPYTDIPAWPHSTAPGHKGRLVFGTIAGKRVVCMQGRVHGYEGYSPKEVTFPVQVLKSIGVKILFLTNASGSVNTEYLPGEIVCVSDHINFTGSNPLVGKESSNGAKRFPDMTHAYDPALMDLAERCALAEGFRLKRGVYIGFSGPSYETPAEIRMARVFGADLVGMSTVSEAIVANSVGMRICALSCVANFAAGITGDALTEEEVLDSMERVSSRLGSLLRSILEAL